MTLLSKTAILAENDLKSEDIEVPEWGGAVRVRSFTGRERDTFEASTVRGDGKDRKVDLTNMRAPGGSQPGDKALHRVVAVRESVRLDQVLVDAHRVSPQLHLRFDPGSVRLAR